MCELGGKEGEWEERAWTLADRNLVCTYYLSTNISPELFTWMNILLSNELTWMNFLAH